MNDPRDPVGQDRTTEDRGRGRSSQSSAGGGGSRSSSRRGHGSRASFVIAALRDCRLRPPRRFLDVGFIGDGKGPSLHQEVAAAFSDDYFVGIDIRTESSLFRDDERRRYLQLSIFDVDRRPDFRSSFDAALFCEVFEHLKAPCLALEKIAFCLRPGGRLVMTWPNPIALKSLIRYLLVRDLTRLPELRGYLGAEDHMVLAMPPSMVALLDRIGFDVVEVGFPKAAWRGVAPLARFGPYVGLVAEKRCEPA